MSRKAQSFIGLRFGRFIVIENAPTIRKFLNGKLVATMPQSVCRCDCGNERIVRNSCLKLGKSKSCGCYTKDLLTKHGLAHSPTWDTWQRMKSRCLNEKHPQFKDYGGRGIKICRRWMKFENFLKDMGIRPDNTSIDRIDNNGNYKKSNCRWANSYVQQGNRRSCRYFEVNGIFGCLAGIARRFGINWDTLDSRLKSGMSIDVALKTPIKYKKNRK